MKPEILYYNTHEVPRIILESKQKILPFLANNYSDDLLNAYNKHGLNKHNMIYDRSQSIPHYLNIKASAHPMLARDDNFSMSFFEVCEQRAKELVARNKSIYVMWSGGIDSTFILFLLNKYAASGQVKIYGTYNSIIESGDLFDRRLRHEFEYDIETPTDSQFAYKQTDCIFVSGMCGNQLFGPTDDFFSNVPNAMFHHTLGTPETIYEGIQGNIDQELLDFLEPMIKNSPRKLETVNDLRWYCIFNLDWYTAVYEHRILAEQSRAKRVVPFFDTNEFQQWAITTKEPFTKVKGNPNTHRWQMREILDEHFDEAHYAWNKEKKISNFNVYRPQWLFLLNDFYNVLDD